MRFLYLSLWLLVMLVFVLVACGAPATPTLVAPTSSATATILPSPTATTEPSAASTTVSIATPTRGLRPTATEKPATPTRAEPTPTIAFAPHFDHVWERIPSIVIVTKKDDPRIAEVHQAVDFWNEQLKAMGTPLRLGTITEVDNVNPDDLVPLKYRISDPASDPGSSTGDLPEILQTLKGDIIMTLTSFDITSRNILAAKDGQPVPGGRDLIIIKNFPANVGFENATGAVIHELGHAVGLSHDNYPLSVMCGPPWMDTCRARQIVLDPDQKYILSLYPPTWKPMP